LRPALDEVGFQRAPVFDLLYAFALKILSRADLGLDCPLLRLYDQDFVIPE
jgi:hypothetical protein